MCRCHHCDGGDACPESPKHGDGLASPASSCSLLPCPFCGSPAEFAISYDRGEEDLQGWVSCTNCGADGPLTDQKPDDRTKEEIAKLWNTRENDSGQAPPPGESGSQTERAIK